MKNKRKIHYSISKLNYWWCGNKLKWIHTNKLQDSGYKMASSNRTMYSFKRALKELNNSKKGSVLTRFYYKKGKRWSVDFIRL